MNATTSGPALVSADAHVVEPLEVFAAVAKRFGTGAPRLLHDPERGTVLDTGLGRTFQPGRFATAGLTPGTPAYRKQEHSGYARDSLTSVRARLADMDRDGVEAEVLFPTMVGRFVGRRAHPPEMAAALLRSYNDWLADYCREASRRLFPLACIHVDDLEAAVDTVAAARARGHVGVVLPCAAPAGRSYMDPAYDRLWAVAQAEGLPIALHAGVGSAEDDRPPAPERHGLHYVLQHHAVAVTMSDVVLGGVGTRFPDLRFVATEYEIGWIGHFLARMDWRQLRHGERTGPRFSDAWRRSFAATFTDDAIGILTRDAIGVSSLLWAGDYPHGDSVWPRSRRTLTRLLAPCTAAERRAMTRGNVIELYRLPLAAAAGRAQDQSASKR